jgi:hypothetical protein
VYESVQLGSKSIFGISGNVPQQMASPTGQGQACKNIGLKDYRTKGL